MEKFITITDTTTGQKHIMDLINIGGFSSTATVLTIEYLPIVGQSPATFEITHDTASPATAFKDWFVDQMEDILALDWKRVTAEPTPPYTVTDIS